MSIPHKLAGLSMSIDMIVCLFVCCRASWAKFLLLCQANYPQISDPSLCRAFCFVFVSATAASFWSLSQTDSLTGTTKGQKPTSRHDRGPRLKDDDNCTPQVRRGVVLPNSVRIRRSRHYLQCASNEHVRNPSKLSIDRSREREREREREIASLKSILLHELWRMVRRRGARVCGVMTIAAAYVMRGRKKRERLIMCCVFFEFCFHRHRDCYRLGRRNCWRFGGGFSRMITRQ
jgi:hypothetical protein